MKPKLLFLYGGIKPQVFPLAKAFEKYYNVHVCYGVIDYPYRLEYETELPKVHEVEMSKINPKHYDFAFAYDPGCLNPLIEFSNVSGKPVGCNILDIPLYTFCPNRNEHTGLKLRWSYWFEQLKSVNFITSYKAIVLKEIKSIDVPKKAMFSPIEVFPKPEGCEKRATICFSGRIVPDKGLHTIMDVLSMVGGDFQLIAMGTGKESLEDYAKYLKIDYLHLPNCSQEEKYRNYYESMGIVSCADNGENVGYPPLEAIAIGVPAVATDWPQARLTYGDHVFYARPYSLASYAKELKTMLTDPEAVKKKLKGAKEHCAKMTNDKWAEMFHEFVTGLGIL